MRPAARSGRRRNGSGEAARHDTTRQVLWQLALDEARHAVAVATLSGLCEKRFEVCQQDPVKNAILRMPANVGPGAWLLRRWLGLRCCDDLHAGRASALRASRQDRLGLAERDRSGVVRPHRLASGLKQIVAPSCWHLAPERHRQVTPSSITNVLRAK
jgi:hypothetical protein